MTPDALLFAYVAALLAAIAVLAFYTDQRRRRFGPTPTDDHVFRCVKCGYVYTDDPDVDHSRCAQCGTLNEVIRF
jgi:rubrerythrin